MPSHDKHGGNDCHADQLMDTDIDWRMGITAEQVAELAARMRPFRCSRCGRFLCKEAIVDGLVLVKCRSCKAYNLIGPYSST
jgi:phage FluMu protein Com